MDKKKQITNLNLVVPISMKERLLAEAESRDRKPSYIVREIIEQHFRRLEIERAVEAQKA